MTDSRVLTRDPSRDSRVLTPDSRMVEQEEEQSQKTRLRHSVHKRRPAGSTFVARQTGKKIGMFVYNIPWFSGKHCSNILDRLMQTLFYERNVDPGPII